LPALAGVDGLVVVLVLATLARIAGPVWRLPEIQTWTTVFVALCVQATPYVVLGVLLGAAVSAVPGSWFAGALSRRRAVAVVLAAVTGSAVPGCECGSVPLAAGALRRGVGAGPAVALMVSGPAANPVVLAATAAAYPGEPAMVCARWLASMLVALAAGLLWTARRGPVAPRPVGRGHGSLAGELGRSLGLLTVGAACAATLTTQVPHGWLGGAARPALVGAVVLAVLAVLVGSCSTADAFVARSLAQFSRTAQLVFMVVGPTSGARVVAMQAGALGARFAVRFAPVAFLLALTCALVVGAVLL
jgi:uncharacterized membrane protein YraQ (UPF0718 family)